MARKKAGSTTSGAASPSDRGISAKFKYSRSRKTTEVIPRDVTRARNGAWLDLISPITEWAGLRGDQYRHRRAQLRLQQEATLKQIAAEADKKRSSIERPQKVIPPKFLIPFLEQASLEDVQSGLIDLWSSLLVSASENYEPHHVHFVSIISQMAPSQAVLFRKMLGTDTLHNLERASDEVNQYFSILTVRENVRGEFIRKFGHKPSEIDDDDFADFVVNYMGSPAVFVVHAAFENNHSNEYFDIQFPYNLYEDSDEIDCSILEALGLVRHVETDFFDVGPMSLCLWYYHLTRLGFHFAKACKLLPD